MRFAPQHAAGRRVTLGLCLFLAFMAIGYACQVPVFRYALERWTPDFYEVVATPGSNGFTEAEKEALALLESLRTSEDVPVNFTLREETNENPGGALHVFYPGKIPGLPTAPIWSGELTESTARSLVDSPVRRELAKRILEGQSAIWVIVESGNAEADDEAEKLIEQAARRAEENLRIPEGVVGRNEIAAGAPLPHDRENILQSDVPLKIEFSLLRVSRNDPAEALFLPMLLKLEDDLHEWAEEPMAFPVFGRGRVLEPLIGKGINEANVLEYSGYLCGACSCEVKDQNPGMDLLLAVNWDAAIAGSEVIIEKVLPPLEGTSVLLGASPEVKDGEKPINEAGTGQSATEQPEPDASEPGESRDSKTYLSLGISLAVVLLLLGVGSMVILRGGRK